MGIRDQGSASMGIRDQGSASMGIRDQGSASEGTDRHDWLYLSCCFPLFLA